MGKLIDLTGQQFGRLEVIKRAENKGKSAAWLCKCDCGKKTIVRGDDLIRRKQLSCGCYKSERQASFHRTHGGRRSRLYSIWTNMHKRCYYDKFNQYNDYGGRGITICAEWLHDFAAFRDWALSHGYRDDLSIDRIDNDKGYSPDNCRWATMKEQQNNKRNTKMK